MLKLIFFSAFLLCFGQLAGAQKWTPRYIGMTQATHGYNEYLPEGYKSDGTAAYPLILYIHGNSERGIGDSADLAKAATQGLENVMRKPGFPTSFTVNGQVHRFIVIAPQFEPRPNVLDVDSVLNYVLAHYPVDRNRVYLTGFSMGGGSCWDYAGSVAALTNKLAALLPISGSGTPDTIKTRTIAVANLPVWATQNDGDPVVPVSNTITYVDWINQSPAPTPLAKKTIFHSTVHEAWPSTYNPAFKEGGLNVFEWMLQYKRRPLAPATQKLVKVNVYGGLHPFVDPQWNNWNVKDSLQSDKFRYNDATASAIRATLSKNGGVGDNGLTYGGGMAPAEVLRHYSYGTSTRTLILSGLSTSSTYTLELYASRNSNSGFVTVFTINGSSQSISTYNNLTAKAVFQNLKPDSAGNLSVSIKGTNYYNYFNGFVLTETFSTINQPPVANAGSDKTITLPANSLTLSGSGHDNDGSIKSYKWAKGAGPLPFTICSPTSATTTINGLTAGTYTFQLTVTDNSGATANDEVQVTVKPVPATTKYIRVNLYGGSNPYNNPEWNNWNFVASSTSSAFKYFDGSPSTITSTIQYMELKDNGSSYGGCVAPPEVLHYASYSSATRTLTLKGLSSSKTYDLEFYASRSLNSSDSTVFTINGVSKKLATYQNRTTKVSFTSLSPNAQGQINVTISSTKNYNYLNGFTLVETDAPVTRIRPRNNSAANLIAVK